MKKFYIFLISGCVAVFFSFGAVLNVSASPGLSGIISSSKSQVSPGEEFTITVRGTTDTQGKAMEQLQLISEQTGEQFWYNCIIDDGLPGKKLPVSYGNIKYYYQTPDPIWGTGWQNGKKETTCTFNWIFNTSDKPLSEGSYTFSAWVFDFNYADPLHYASKVTEGWLELPQKITVSVTSGAAPTPEICKTIVPKGGVSKSAEAWCGEMEGSCEQQKFGACFGNNWLYFGCVKNWLACNCDPDSAGKIFNDPRCLLSSPTLIEPINNTEISSTGKLKWSAVPDGSDYKISGYRWTIFEIIGNETGGTIDSSMVPLTQTWADLSPQLESGRYYRWTVQAITNDGRESPMENFADFKLAGAPTGGTGPVIGGSGAGQTIPGKQCSSVISIRSPKIYQADGTTVAYDGLVPCGKCVILNPQLDDKGKPKLDNKGYLVGAATYIDCQLCHFFVMFKGIVDWVIGILVPFVVVLMVIIAGLMFFFGGQNPQLLTRAQNVLKSVVIGLLIIFAAYLIVNAILGALNVADFSAQGFDLRKWFQISCPIKLP